MKQAPLKESIRAHYIGELHVCEGAEPKHDVREGHVAEGAIHKCGILVDHILDGGFVEQLVFVASVVDAARVCLEGSVLVADNEPRRVDSEAHLAEQYAAHDGR